MKPFLILQLRPETEASDDEYRAILDKGGLEPGDTLRIRLDRTPDLTAVELERFAGVIVGGGPGCVSDDPANKSARDAAIEAAVLSLMPQITAQDFPFMGCCYGIGILGHHLGGDVSKVAYGEPVGAVDCRLTPEGEADPVLAGVPPDFRAFVGHKEALQALPEGCTHLVASAPCPYQMIRYRSNVYATQFHPEADAENFVVRIGIYRDHGYFPAADAEALTARCRAEDVHAPRRVLANFVRRFRTG